MLWGACVSSPGSILLSPIKLEIRGKILREYEPMTEHRGSTSFSLPPAVLTADCWLTPASGLVCTWQYGTKSLVYRRTQKKHAEELTWAMCTVGWRWGLRWSLAAAREEHIKTRCLSTQNQTTAFWCLLNLFVSISKNKHYTESMMGETDKPERLTWC